MPQRESGTRQSGQPHKLYTFSEKIDEIIFEKLGVAEGFIDFQHKLQFIDDMIDLAEMMIAWEGETEEDNELLNNFTGKPVPTKVDRKTIGFMTQIWYHGGYFVHQHIETTDTDEIIQTKFYFEPPDEYDHMTMEIEPAPALISMKSRDELSSDKPLLRIGEVVPNKIAFKYEDPILLSKEGKLQYEVDGKIYDRYKTDEDIENDIDYTKDVPRSYYDRTTSNLWSAIKSYVDKFRVGAWRMAKEMNEWQFNEEHEDTDYSETTEMI